MNRRSLYVVVFTLVFGCAPSGPSAYSQSVSPALPPPRPAPVYRPVEPMNPREGPGVGPYVWPGRENPNGLPRSPYTRVLPEDENTRKGPGLWAGNEHETHASAKSRRTILGVVLPLPKESAPFDQVIAESCAGEAQNGLKAKKIDLAKIPLEDRPCLAARLFQGCLVAFKGEHERTRNGKSLAVNMKVDQRLEALRIAVEEFAKKSCRSDLEGPSASLLEALLEWYKHAAARVTGTTLQ